LKEGRKSLETGFEIVCMPNKTDEKNINVILPSVDESVFKMVSKPLGGTIILQESIEELPYPTIISKKKKNHKLPKDLKERHPVYGVCQSHIVEKEKSPPPISKHKKSKHKKINNVQDYDYDQDDLDIKIEKKKKKKMKSKKDFEDY